MQFLNFRLPFRLILMVAVAVLSSCSAPRLITHSGMVTPKGHVKTGGNSIVTVSSETVNRLAVLSRDAIKLIANQDSVVLSEQTDNISAALISYALDPSGGGFDVYGRYGIAKRVDVGYKYTFGAHAFDGMYQFLGPVGDEEEAAGGQWYGSAGLQYSWQKTGLPDKLFLDRLDPVLAFKALRRDLIFPVVFSYAFGPKERYGHIALGAVYQRSFLRYDFNPGRLYEYLPNNVQQQVPPISEKRSYGAAGFFINGKVGYKHVYFLPALSIYYQNYGRYKLPGGTEVSMKGLTVIPAMGIQLWFGKGR